MSETTPPPPAAGGPDPVPDPASPDGPSPDDAARPTTATPPSHPPAGTTRVADDLRSLRRSRSDRVVAGVLGGLGRRLGVDPVILRVVTVVLALFGGAGILLYALGWLLVPEEGEDLSALDQALGRGRPGTDRTPAVLLAAFLGIVALVAAGGVLSGSWDGAALLVLSVVGVVLLLRRGGASGDLPQPRLGGPAAGFDPTHDTPGSPPAGYSPSADERGTEDPGAAWAAAATAPAPPASGAEPWQPQPAWQAQTWEQPAWQQPGWEQPAWDQPGYEQQQNWDPAAAPARPAAPRPRSVLGPVTVSLALLGAGALAVLDGPLGFDVPFAAYVAAPLGVVGAGLLLGTWFGRSRGLVWLGLLLVLALVPAVAADRFGAWDAQDVTVQPTTVAELAGPHEYDAGRVLWDLTALELPEAGGATLTVDQGAGNLVVVVPRDADVTLDATVGVGELRAFDSVSGGFGREVSTTDTGPDGAGGGEIALELDLGAGQLEVRREAP
ncbi:MAG TPA: PspC domain-containing protein [Jiangellales bacterium]|nr:PspC domain-containing protein [Jiangellales bacterium]